MEKTREGLGSEAGMRQDINLRRRGEGGGCFSLQHDMHRDQGTAGISKDDLQRGHIFNPRGSVRSLSIAQRAHWLFSRDESLFKIDSLVAGAGRRNDNNDL